MQRKHFSAIALFVLSLILSLGMAHILRADNLTSVNLGYEQSISSTALAREQIKFPDNYKNTFLHYATIECPNSVIVRKMYANSTATAAAKNQQNLPEGSVIVMETHGATRNGNRLSPVRLNNIFVRAKTANSQNNSSENWQSRWFSPSGNLVSNSEGSCRSCHNRVKDRDYMFTLPQLVNSANTNQLQYRQTEFGLAVCR